MQAPTAAELLNDPTVVEALEDAWSDSLPADPARRREEGGWVYKDTTTGALLIRRAPAGGQALLDLSTPPSVPCSVVVAVPRAGSPGPVRRTPYPPVISSCRV